MLCLFLSAKFLLLRVCLFLSAKTKLAMSAMSVKYKTSLKMSAKFYLMSAKFFLLTFFFVIFSRIPHDLRVYLHKYFIYLFFYLTPLLPRVSLVRKLININAFTSSARAHLTPGECLLSPHKPRKDKKLGYSRSVGL
jgi:hypothetical protein